eukprot:gnl/TRDRNA2_/TRDRNA2_194923_c0_seq1.p1 gnl/TRDRNA2_/TRDRNA2_194923_c0~~gnl/TRDRNA2_/TRDRNA2_194923_c0_seq1.p1  ORF type:complete len:276 (+),score=43.08 gnl/TRDRNA2_/TRDRNA2_194923_c0_seq1:22-828(+)
MPGGEATNTADLLCPRCDVILLCAGKGIFESRTTTLPWTSARDAGSAAEEDVSEFWAVHDLYSFDNVAFSKSVGERKFLCCPDCELGPLGFREVQPGEVWPPVEGAPAAPTYVAACRVVQASAEHPAKPNKSMTSAEAALAGLTLDASRAPQQDGQEIVVTFSQPVLGMYFRELPPIDENSYPDVIIAAFEPVNGKPGEAEEGGQLAVGDVVKCIHGVETFGFTAEDTGRLTGAAPRPFKMAFWRPTVVREIAANSDEGSTDTSVGRC